MSANQGTATARRPMIAITMGDPAGIGPEIAAKALADPRVLESCQPLVIGDMSVMEQAVRIAGVALTVRGLTDVPFAPLAPGSLPVLDLHNVNLDELHCGEVSAMAGQAAYEAIRKAIELAMAGRVDATVTGPINKQSLHAAGHNFPGHTEIYAHFTKTDRYAMLLADRNLRVVHVTSHVPLRAVGDLITKQRVYDAIRLLDDACRKLGFDAPRIGVAGLNPHASDGGLFGDEERLAIAPAIEQARQAGIRAEGPVSPDTLFAKAKGGRYDGCVAMYHDQGLIPFKYGSFEWDGKTGAMKRVGGVNITLGLPIVRTSVDHGTAFEIAGQGVASPEAMVNAIEYAVRLIGS